MNRRAGTEPRPNHRALSAEALQAELEHERIERSAVELALDRLQTQLAQARAALAGTRAGEQRARHLACHDPLTALPNLRYFRARLEDRLARERPQQRTLAVFFIDLDGFKQINDRHGHQVGDALLRITAARMRHAVRREDLVGRIGGDEFACIIDGLPGRDPLRHVACKLFGTICAPMTVRDVSYRVRPSIGIALFPDDAVTSASLLEHADAAMYAAKRQQIGYSFFDAAARGQVAAAAGPGSIVAS